jgi:hypothetical protein
MHETNLLSLIKSWLDIIYQITTKNITIAFRRKFQELNSPGRQWPRRRRQNGDQLVFFHGFLCATEYVDHNRNEAHSFELARPLGSS